METAPAPSIIYTEQVTSARTEALFVTLALSGLFLFAWRVTSRGLDLWSIAALVVWVMFLFYSLNYRTLHIRLTTDTLQLIFGVIRWSIAVDNIESCSPDNVSLRRIGGAGIHFTSIDGRYRAMFNFLEYPRLVVALKERRGPVRDIAFTTRQPEELTRLLTIIAGNSLSDKAVQSQYRQTGV